MSPDFLAQEHLGRLLGSDVLVIAIPAPNNGTQIAHFLNPCPATNSYAVEPDPCAIKKFTSSILDELARLFEIAVGASDAEVRIRRQHRAIDTWATQYR